MNSLKVLRFVRNYQLLNCEKKSKLRDIKPFSLSAMVCKDAKNPLSQLEERFRRLFNENADQLSPLKPLIDRWMSKPWIAFFGEKSKSIPIKEKKEAKGLKDGMFRVAFDLAGFKTEDIHIIVSNNKLYIEAKKEETTKDGTKAWREFSFECDIEANVNPSTITANFDSEGLLVIDGQLPKESLSGVKKNSKH